MKRRTLIGALAALLAGSASGQDPASDVVLRALREELKRARQLQIGRVESPYYIEFALDDLNSFSTAATLGAEIRTDRNRSRIPRVQVRVGSREFDNTNYIFSDLFAGGGGRLPIDDSANVIRRGFWLAADRAYKGGLEAIARKRAALKSVTQQEQLNDFAPAEPLKHYEDAPKAVTRDKEWVELARRLSRIFVDYPAITGSTVEVDAGYSVSYFVNSEGTEARYPDDLFYIRAVARCQAEDGMPLYDAIVFQSRSPDRLPGEAEARRGIEEMAKNLVALQRAPQADDYTGPVLIEGVAAPQMFAQVVGANLGLTRRPVMEPGRSFPLPESELQGRLGSRLMPEWMDVVDDPTQQSYRNEELQGSYAVDMEGVAPKPLAVIEQGVLKAFLLTRLPVRGFEGSNGRARLPGAFGAKAAVFSNLFVKARQTSTPEALKKQLLEMVAQRGKPYGLIIRKLDMPSATPQEQMRRAAMGAGQRSGGGRPLSLPGLVYRVYPDGKEELVRGLRFRSLGVRSLRDILAASDTEQIFHFIGNGSPLPPHGASGYVAPHTVVAPAVLFDELELERREEDWPKLPIVPPPPLVAGR